MWDTSNNNSSYNELLLQDAVFVPAPEKTEASEPVYFLPEKQEALEQPVYFLTGDPDSLHADRSPYTFEPASQGPAANVKPTEDWVAVY